MPTTTRTMLATLLAISPAVASASDLIREGLIQDLDAARGLRVVDGKVASWENQASAGGDDLAQPKAKRRPELDQDAVNGGPALVFAHDWLAGDDADAFDALVTGSGYTWFVVARAHEQVAIFKNRNAIFGTLKNSRPWSGLWVAFNDDNTLWHDVRPVFENVVPKNRVQDGKLDARQFHVIAGRLAEGNGKRRIELYVDSAEPRAHRRVRIRRKTESEGLAVGQERTDHQGQEAFHGAVARLLIYDRPLGDRELRATLRSLASTYGISSRDRPSDH